MHCNNVYQDYISQKNHIHMNATQWETLTEFAKWLGKEGHCAVDKTPKGWYITYIDKNTETIEKQTKMASKERMELDDQERMAKFLGKQIGRAIDTEGAKQEVVHTELQRDNEEKRIQFHFSRRGTSKLQKSSTNSNPLSSNPLKQDAVKKASSKHPAKRKSSRQEIVDREKSKKKKL